MAARKKSRKGRASRSRASATNLGRRVDRELSDLRKEVDRRLKPLRRELEKAERKAGSQAARVIREARKRLNDVELSGDSDVTKFMRRRRRDLSQALTGLSRRVQPARNTRRTRKK